METAIIVGIVLGFLIIACLNSKSIIEALGLIVAGIIGIIGGIWVVLYIAHIIFGDKGVTLTVVAMIMIFLVLMADSIIDIILPRK